MEKIRVVIADDHPVLRNGIRSMLGRVPDILVVGEANNGEEALQLVDDLNPDILLLDIEMADLSGVEVAQRLQRAQSSVEILILSAHDDQQYVKQVLAIGVSGYLLKEEATEVIVDAVRSVAHGEKGWFSHQVAARLAQWNRTKRSTKQPLSERELETLKLVVQGKTNQAIGQMLGISEKTVEKHLDSVYRKLGVSSRTEAAVRAVREGLV